MSPLFFCIFKNRCYLFAIYFFAIINNFAVLIKCGMDGTPLIFMKCAYEDNLFKIFLIRFLLFPKFSPYRIDTDVNSTIFKGETTLYFTLSVRPVICNAMVELWFSLMLLKIDSWNFSWRFLWSPYVCRPCLKRHKHFFKVSLFV